MSKPLFTALIGTYNQGRFIEQAIESVLAQNLPPSEREVIVVDDGSTDDTAARVARFADRVRYVPKANGGQASAMNCGIELSSGEYVAFLDGDDLWLPGKADAVVRAFEADTKVGFVYHALQYWDSRTNEFHDQSGFTPLCGDVLADWSSLMRFGGISTSAMIFRRRAVTRLLPIPLSLRILADGYLGYLAIFLGPVMGIREPLTRYRIHGENLCSFDAGDCRKMEVRSKSSQAVSDSMRNWLASHGYDLADPRISAYLRRHELVAERVAFSSQAPGRGDFFRHTQAWNQLYGQLWTPQYRVFRGIHAMLALVLGYHGFRRVEELYRQAGLAALRERFAAAHRPLSSPTAAPADRAMAR